MTQNEAYKLADNLQMELMRSGSTLTGEKQATIAFGSLSLSATVKIVSSYASKESDGVVIVSTFGDVGLLMGVSGSLVRCSVLDLSKVAKRGEGLLGKSKPKTIEDAEALLANAIVGSFERKASHPWLPAAA